MDDVSLDGCVGTLPAPNLVSPIVSATNDTTPTFEWSAVTDAASYRLVVDNITSGGTPIDVTTAATSFTPASVLPASSIYQWNVRALDAGAIPGAASPPMLLEIDTQPPPAVILSGVVPAGGPTPVTGLVALEASSERTVKGFVKENIIDGDLDTHWSSIGTDSPATEYITVDLDSVKTVLQIRLRSDSGNGRRFPKDFQIQMSDDNASYTTVVSVNDFVADPITWYDFDLAAPFDGQYVRIWVTAENKYSRKFYSQIAEIEVIEQRPSFGIIEYSWDAPADDEGGGEEPAATYDFRLMVGDETTFDYGTANTFEGEPTPVLNAMQQVLVEGLLDETAYAQL